VVIAAECASTSGDSAGHPGHAGCNLYTRTTNADSGNCPKTLVIVGGGSWHANRPPSSPRSDVGHDVIRGARAAHSEETLSRRFNRIAASKWEVRSNANILGSHETAPASCWKLDGRSELQADAVWWLPAGHTAIGWMPKQPESRWTIAVLS